MKPVVLGLGICFAVRLSCAAPVQDSEGLRAAHESYRTCATLQLPDNFARVPSPKAAADAAVERCEKQRLALAGQFALDNPGTRATGAYIDTARQRVAADLANWMADMKTLGVQVGMQPPR